MGNYLSFFNQAVDLIKGSNAFRDRLGDYHSADRFADPDAVTEAEANQLIFGDDHGYFYALADKDAASRKKTMDLMPFAEIAGESHTEFQKGGTCGEEFFGMESTWSVYFLDKARDATSTEIDVDPKASLIDFTTWIDAMLDDFKTANANNNYWFSSIDIANRPMRTDPQKRNDDYDFWLCEIQFTIDEDG